MDEALEALKRLYPGVRGRVTELFDIPNRRYAMAVAAALGHNQKAIVVDDERTAVESIKVGRGSESLLVVYNIIINTFCRFYQ